MELKQIVEISVSGCMQFKMIDSFGTKTYRRKHFQALTITVAAYKAANTLALPILILDRVCGS